MSDHQAINDRGGQAPRKGILTVLAITVILLTGTGVGYSPACEPEESKLLPVTWVSQQNYRWCWAATTEMLVEFLLHDSDVKQCELVKELRVEQAQQTGQSLAGENCCQDTPQVMPCFQGNGGCNSAGWLDLSPYHITAEDPESPLSWENLKRQISCHGAPMGYAFKNAPGQSGSASSTANHIVVIIGYGTSQTSAGLVPVLVINDPADVLCGTNKAYDEKLMLYSEYALRGNGAHGHTRTWHSLTLNAN